MTEAEAWARAEGVEIERVEWSAEERDDGQPLRPSGGVMRTPEDGR